MFIKIISKGGEPSDFISIKALATIINLPEGTKKGINKIHYELRNIDSTTNDVMLDFCHPYPDSSAAEDEQTGTIYIVINEKYKAFVDKFSVGGKSPAETEDNK